MKEDAVFSYMLKDAWCYPLCDVSVSEDGTVRYQNGENEERSLQLEKAEVEKIKEIVSEHPEVLNYKELEFPAVLDGVVNFFDFKATDGRTVHLMAFNIGEVKDPDMRFSKGLLEEYVSGEVVVPVKAMEVVKTFEEIAAILIKHGVDAKCLRLTYGITDEDEK